ncbi:twin-arginine translocase subunit TatC [Streptomyces pathocidini]|uniref:Sec-independent protein translocase protein TatC n=1 Tax=Streptomyces pathocidini TaxID=1650571 RepID=A0ABW7USN7_9ACTN|nr:twin-arginine translocase subunit TatC [Streptomyces pathocidini]
MLKSARKQQQRDPEGRMPLAEHLRELRNRLVKSVLAVLVITIAAGVYYEPIADFLTAPIRESVGCTASFKELATQGDNCAQLTIDGLLGPFTIMIKVALMTGVVLACPVWLFQLWAFLAPGLHRHEKKYALSFVGAGIPLFLGGAYFAYLILPTSAAALIGLTPDGLGISNLVKLDDYLDIVTRLVVVFGLAFELPLLLVLLNFGGVVSGRRMLGWWRWMIMGITIFSAVATPTGDPMTMLALAAPIVFLYYAATGIALANDRRRRRSNPDAGLDDDEASDLDLTPESVDEIEPVQPSRMLPEQASGPDRDERRDGFDDVT